MHINLNHKPLDLKPLKPGVIPPCPVSPDALINIPRQQTNPSIWDGDGWQTFVSDLASKGITVEE